MTAPIGEDMPISCEYCFFWHQSRCTRGSDGCFYLMKIKRSIGFDQSRLYTLTIL